MAATAYRTVYKEEFIAGYEERETWLRKTVTTKAQVRGNTLTFLVADSGGASAVTRGPDGLIPARADNNTQLSATIAEWHDKVRKTQFTLDMSQGEQRQIAQMTSMGVLNRKIDADIIAQLDTATINTSPTQTATVALVESSLAELALNDVPVEDEENMFGLVTPSFYGYISQTPEWSSSDYVDMKWYANRNVRLKRWRGVNWIRHSKLTGAGSSTEKCYIYHKDSIGHGMDRSRLDSAVGFNDEDAYQYVRTSGAFGSKLLQNNGVVQILHNGSAHNLS